MLLFVTLVTPITVFAEDEAVAIEMASTKLQMGVSTELSLVLQNIDSAELVSFDGLENFEILSTNQSNTSKSVNGQSTKEAGVTYSLMPKEVGSFQLKAVIKVDGDTYETNTVKVTVTERDDSLKEIEEDIFLRTIVSNESVYFGDKVVITYELYSRYQVEGFDFTEDVVFDGFVVETSEKGDFKPTYLTIDGNQYVMYRAEQLVLNATKPGDYLVPSFQFQANIGNGSYFGSSKAMYLASDEVALKVKPLPEENRQEDFSGLVGDLTLEASYSKTVVESGDPITLDVTVSGKGNLDGFSSLSDNEAFNEFSVYETEKELEKTITEQGYEASKSYELILVPKSTGDLKIKAIEMPYFNTQTQTYEVMTIPETAIVVNGNKAESTTTNTTGSENTKEAILIHQINYGDGDDAYLVIRVPKEGLKNLVIGIVIMGVLILGSLLLYRVHKKNNEPLRLLKRELIKAKDDKGIYEVMVKAIRQVYNAELRSLSSEEIDQVIVDPIIASELKAVVSYMEYGRYHGEERFEEMKKIGMKIISEIIMF